MMRKISDLLVSFFFGREEIKQGGMPPCQKMFVAVLLLFFISCTSCTTPSTKTDADILIDADIIVDIDIDNEIQDTESDETVDGDTVLSDGDSIDYDGDTLPDETPDLDTIEEWADYDYLIGTEGDKDCPSLYTAPFPYIGTDGRKHFCRKCDLPAPKNDPHCIRNLWEMNNRAIMKEWPQYYCYPLPCDMTDKAYAPDSSEYHGVATVGATSSIYNNSTGIFRQADIWEGKIGMYATAGKRVKSFDDKYIVRGSLLYDIAAQKYTLISNSGTLMAYNHDRFLFIVGNAIDLLVYIVSAKKVADGWKYEFVYTDEWNRIKFAYPPAIGENFVLINVENIDGHGGTDILYANVNDWDFKKLGEGTIVYPQIFEGIAYFNLNYDVFACDLTKNPTDIVRVCRKINREGESSKSFAVNKQDSKKVIYTDRNSVHQLNIADLTNETITYTKLELEKTPDLIKFIPSQWDGDIFVLEELYQFSSVDIDYRICYYSVSKDKKICFPPPREGKTMGYIYGGVEGKYITWQTTGGTTVRDMECYCKERSDLCLYDEYMPDEDAISDEDIK